MSKGGVTLRTAQAAMRHSDPSLTANVYTDPKLLNIHGALDVLPSLPIGGAGLDHAVAATGTDPKFALPFVLTQYKPSTNQTIADKTAGKTGATDRKGTLDITSSPVNAKRPLTTAVSGPSGVGAIGLEPMTPSVSSRGRSQFRHK